MLDEGLVSIGVSPLTTDYHTCPKSWHFWQDHSRRLVNVDPGEGLRNILHPMQMKIEIARSDTKDTKGMEAFAFDIATVTFLIDYCYVT